MATGCSTPVPVSEPKYDAVELINYEKCISVFVDTFTYKYRDATQKATVDYLTNLPKTLDLAKQSCKSLKPVKK
jgi:hypothetical protein